MKKLIATLALVAALFTPAPAHADNDCYIGDYQGTPIEVCPEPEPDPTNCYTGDYQGHPHEVCMPTGWTPPADWTYNGEPIVMHPSKNYVEPIQVSASAPAPPTTTVTEPVVDWVTELQEALVAAGSLW